MAESHAHKDIIAAPSLDIKGSSDVANQSTEKQLSSAIESNDAERIKIQLKKLISIAKKQPEDIKNPLPVAKILICAFYKEDDKFAEFAKSLANKHKNDNSIDVLLLLAKALDTILDICVEHYLDGKINQLSPNEKNLFCQIIESAVELTKVYKLSAEVESVDLEYFLRNAQAAIKILPDTDSLIDTVKETAKIVASSIANLEAKPLVEHISKLTSKLNDLWYMDVWCIRRFARFSQHSAIHLRRFQNYLKENTLEKNWKIHYAVQEALHDIVSESRQYSIQRCALLGPQTTSEEKLFTKDHLPTNLHEFVKFNLEMKSTKTSHERNMHVRLMYAIHLLREHPQPWIKSYANILWKKCESALLWLKKNELTSSMLEASIHSESFIKKLPPLIDDKDEKLSEQKIYFGNKKLEDIDRAFTLVKEGKFDHLTESFQINLFSLAALDLMSEADIVKCIALCHQLVQFNLRNGNVALCKKLCERLELYIYPLTPTLQLEFYYLAGKNFLQANFEEEALVYYLKMLNVSSRKNEIDELLLKIYQRILLKACLGLYEQLNIEANNIKLRNITTKNISTDEKINAISSQESGTITSFANRFYQLISITDFLINDSNKTILDHLKAYLETPSEILYEHYKLLIATKKIDYNDDITDKHLKALFRYWNLTQQQRTKIDQLRDNLRTLSNEGDYLDKVRTYESTSQSSLVKKTQFISYIIAYNEFKNIKAEPNFSLDKHSPKIIKWLSDQFKEVVNHLGISPYAFAILYHHPVSQQSLLPLEKIPLAIYIGDDFYQYHPYFQALIKAASIWIQMSSHGFLNIDTTFLDPQIDPNQLLIGTMETLKDRLYSKTKSPRKFQLIYQKDLLKIDLEGKHYPRVLAPNEPDVETIKQYAHELLLYKASPDDIWRVYKSLPEKSRLDFYQQLGHELRELDDKNKAIYLQKIEEYPFSYGNPIAYKKSRKSWAQTLQTTLATDEKQHHSLIHMEWVELIDDENAPTKTIRSLLHPQVQQYWIQKGWLSDDGTIQPQAIKTYESQFSQRIVLPITSHDLADFEVPIGYAKFYPQNAGDQLAAESLAWHITGNGPVSTLAKFTCPKTQHTYPVLLSRATGKDLGKYDAKTVDERLKAVQPRDYTLKFLETLLLGYEDDRFENMSDKSARNNRMTSFDCERSFAPSIDPQHPEKVNIKSVILCMDQMNDRLDPQAIEQFCSLNTSKLLQNWLTQLAHLDKSYFSRENKESLFLSKEINQWADKNNKYGSSQAYIAFPPGTINILYQRFQRIQKALKLLPQANHFDILKEIYPNIADTYKSVHADKNLKTPNERFNALPTNYKKVKQEILLKEEKKSEAKKTHSLSNVTKNTDAKQPESTQKTIVERSITFKKDPNSKLTAHVLKEGRFNPQWVLENEFKWVDYFYTKGHNQIMSELRNGNIKEYYRLINNAQNEFSKTSSNKEEVYRNVSEFQAYIINHLDFSFLPPGTQHNLLKTLQGGIFDALVFLNCSALTDELLIDIIKNSPNLYSLKIINTNIGIDSRFTGSAFSGLTSYGNQNKKKYHSFCQNLKELHLSHLLYINLYQSEFVVEPEREVVSKRTIYRPERIIRDVHESWLRGSGYETITDRITIPEKRHWNESSLYFPNLKHLRIIDCKNISTLKVRAPQLELLDLSGSTSNLCEYKLNSSSPSMAEHKFFAYKLAPSLQYNFLAALHNGCESDAALILKYDSRLAESISYDKIEHAAKMGKASMVTFLCTYNALFYAETNKILLILIGAHLFNKQSKIIDVISNFINFDEDAKSDRQTNRYYFDFSLPSSFSNRSDHNEKSEEVNVKKPMNDSPGNSTLGK